MQFLKWVLLTIVMVVVVVGGVLAWQVSPWNRGVMISPVDQRKMSIGIAENLWIPKLLKELGITPQLKAPEITAKAAFFVDAKTGRSLFEKNIHDELPIASLTKIMTAIVTLERRHWDDKLYVSPTASMMEPDKMFLRSGEWLSVRELMDGLFLVSANDAAEVMAREVTGDRQEFVNLMNTKARELGMNHTLFINPSGLQEDGMRQYSTAVDVAMMARYLVNKWPEVVEITKQPEIKLPQTDNHQEYDLISGINLVTTYPGVVGLKIGYTPDAGLTIVTLARKGDSEVLGVLLGSEDRREEARKLLDYSFAELGE